MCAYQKLNRKEKKNIVLLHCYTQHSKFIVYLKDYHKKDIKLFADKYSEKNMQH